jgi:hypothetical protein
MLTPRILCPSLQWGAEMELVSQVPRPVKEKQCGGTWWWVYSVGLLSTKRDIQVEDIQKT